MKKVWFALVLALGLFFTSCESCSDDDGTPGEQAAEALEEVGEDFESIGRDLEEAGENVADKAKTMGDKIKKAGENTLDSIEKAGRNLRDEPGESTDDDIN